MKIFFRIIIYLVLFNLFTCFMDNANCDSNDKFCNIPPETGRITAKKNLPSNITVYHIQDAHCQPDAQYNISHIIEKILSNNKNTVVAIEGASGIINLNRYRDFPDKKVLSDVSKYFVNKGYISGAEYLSITRKEPFVIAGTENPDLYRNDHTLMAQSIDKMPAASSEIGKITDGLNAQGKSILNDAQFEFLNKWSDFHGEKTGFQDYLQYICSFLRNSEAELTRFPLLKTFIDIAEKEKNIDFNRLENERLKLLDEVIAHNDKELIKEIFKLDLHYKLHKISGCEYFRKLTATANSLQGQENEYVELKKYSDFLLMSAEIDVSILNTELETAISSMADTLFTTQEQKDLFELTKSALYYRDLINLRIDSSGLKSLENSHCLSWFKTASGKMIHSTQKPDWALIENAILSAFEFYSLARMRDVSMVENLIELLKNKNSSTAVIITGGFHQDGILSELEKRNISYCSIKPVIKKISAENSYFSLVQNIKSPFERWVSGSTLAVASWLADDPLAGAQLKPAREQIFGSMLISAQIRNIAPRDIESIKKNLGEILSKTEIFLDSWLEKYAHGLKIESVEVIGRNLAVTISIGSKKAVFLFHSSDSKSELDHTPNHILENGKLGTDIVEITSNETANRIKDLIKASSIISGQIIRPDSLETLFLNTGLINQYKQGTATLRQLFDAIDKNPSGNYLLSDIFEAANYIAGLNQGEIPDGMITDSHKNPIKTKNPLKLSDLNRTIFEILKNIQSDDNIVPVEKFGLQWGEIFKQRGISHFSVDINIPFEAFADMLYSVLFTSGIDRGIRDFARFDGLTYQLRTIYLTDGSLFVRMTARQAPLPAEIEISESAALTQGIYSHAELKDGVLVIEADGSFTLSYIALAGTDPAKLTATELAKSLKNTSSGNAKIDQLNWLASDMRSFALDHGIIVRAIIFRDQDEKLYSFDNQDSFIKYAQEHLNARFKPLKQGSWSEKSGNMTVSEFTNLQTKHNIILGDLIGGFETFSDIRDFTDLKGKTVLDVGSQLGYNVFYAHFQGASFAAGIDINPYQQKAAREVAAYINETERLFPKQRREQNLKEYTLAPNGTTDGQLYFRTMDLKDKEEETGTKIAQKPPSNIEFAIADARDIPYPDDSFDITNSSYMLFFINNASTALKEMIRVTKPGGIIRFQYSSAHGANSGLLTEALNILKKELSITANYEILYAIEDLLILKIISKDKADTVDQDIATVRNHARRRTTLPNNFEEHPYIYSIHSPISVKPDRYTLIESHPISAPGDFYAITNLQKRNLITAITFLEEIYGKEMLSRIKNINIDTGRNSIAELKDDTLAIHQAGLDHPLLLLSEIEHELFEAYLQGIQNHVLLAYDIATSSISLYKEISAIFMSVSNFVFNYSPDQQQDLIKYLKSSTQIDTEIEVEALNYANLLEKAVSKEWNESDVITEIARYVYRMPQYKSFQSQFEFLNPSIKQNEVNPQFVASALNMANIMKDLMPSKINDKKLFFSNLSPRIAELNAKTEYPALSIKEWMHFIAYVKKSADKNIEIPDNVKQLIEGENFERIFTLYPQTGFLILTDLLKTAIADPADKSDAPYLANFESSELMEIITNLDSIIHKPAQSSPTSVFEAIPMLRRLPPTAWIGSKLNDALIKLNQGKQYSVITIDVAEDDVDVFLDKFKQEIRRQNIVDNNLILLKLTRPVQDASGETALNVVIVAEFLDKLLENAPRMWFQSSFKENEMSYNKTFSPNTNTIDVTSVSFSEFFQKMRGIGSEFYHNETSLFHLMGLNGADVKSVSHELRIYNLHEREYSSEIDLNDLFTQTNIFRESKKHIACLYRLGIISDADLDFAFSTGVSDEQIKQRIQTAIKSAKLDGETDLQLINRKTADFVKLKAGFNRITQIYDEIVNNPFLNSKFPEIEPEFAQAREFIEQERSAALATNDFLFEPKSLKLERKLLWSALQLELFLAEQINYDKQDFLKNSVDLLSSTPDTDATYSQLAQYITWSFPFLKLHGKIPQTIHNDNVPFAISLTLKSLNRITGELDKPALKSVLTSNDPISDMISKSRELENLSATRSAFRDLSAALIETQLPQDLIKMFDTLAKKLMETGFPFHALFTDKQTFRNTIISQPRGMFKMLSYLAFNMYKSKENVLGQIEKIRNLNEPDLEILLAFLKNADYDTFGKSLNNALDLIQKGLTGFLRTQYMDCEKNEPADWLAHSDTVITPITMKNQALMANSTLSRPKTSLDIALNTKNWLSQQNIEAEIVRINRENIAETEYFVKINGFLIGTTPYAPVISIAPEDINAISENETAVLAAQNGMNLGQTIPMKWIQTGDNKGLVFSASVNIYTAQDLDKLKDYIQINVTASMIESGLPSNKRRYILKFKNDKLPGLISKLKNVSIAETMLVLSRDPDVYFSIDGTDIIPQHTDIQLAHFNQLFYNLITHINISQPTALADSGKTGSGLQEPDTICTLRLSKFGKWEPLWNGNAAPNSINIDKYSQAILLSLINTGISPENLPAEKLSIRLVDGYWRLGDTKQVSPDGKTEIILDIRAFKDPLLLDFVIQRQFMTKTGLAGEAKSIYNNIAYVRIMSSQQKEKLMELLNSAGESATANIIGSSAKSGSEIAGDIIRLLSNNTVYPQLNAPIAGKSPYQTAELIARDIDAEFYEHLKSIGYDDAFENLAIMLNPMFQSVKEAVWAYNELSAKTQDIPFPEIMFYRALEGNLSGMENLIEFYFANPDIISQQQYAKMFKVFGIDIITSLITSIGNDKTKSKRVIDLIPELKTEQIMIQAVFDKESIVFKLNYEDEGANNYITFDSTGNLIGKEKIPVSDLRDILPEIIARQTVICETIFAEGIESAIKKLTDLKGVASDKTLFLQKVREINAIFKNFSSEYTALEQPDYSEVALSKQAQLKSITTQFASDLIASPLASAYANTQMMEYFYDSYKDSIPDLLAHAEKAISTLRRIMNSFVKFKLLRDYYISPVSSSNRMIVFDQTSLMPENAELSNLDFTSDTVLAGQIAQKITASKSNDVYAIYFNGQEPSVLVWIKDIFSRSKPEETPKIIIVSPEISGDIMENLLEQTGLDSRKFVIIGKEMVSLAIPGFSTQTPGKTDLNKLIELIRLNTNSTANMVFLTSDTNIFSEFKRINQNVLPLPDINIRPNKITPVKPSNRQLIDQAA